MDQGVVEAEEMRRLEETCVGVCRFGRQLVGKIAKTAPFGAVSE